MRLRKDIDLEKVGIDVEERERAGTYMQVDSQVVKCTVKQEGVEILATKEALEKHPEAKNYLWKALPEDPSLGDFSNGYFIRVKPGTTPFFPVQTCLLIENEDVQHVHNIIVVEEGAELNVITGCSSVPGKGKHIGVSEFYVKKGGKLHFTMIHMWGPEVEVLPKTGVIVEEGGVYISDYVCLHPAARIKAYPTIYLVGKGATTRSQSVLVATKNSDIDLGTRVYLKEEETKAEVVSRSVSFGGRLIARGHLIGEKPGVKAHLECKGLLLTNDGIMHAIPELEGRAKDLEMSHEAAVGKIAKEEIEYLMARGLTEDEAAATIVRGFLNVDIIGIPESLKKELDEIIRMSDSAM
ncbi:Fe-S cluster assembly protein SufBD [Thermosulfidibacter takaii ABI70S6]|uniref:Fe-S cluster assembly protein SufBD n=1 Tax=Thermosulfidibacter takaii (strain DSM 17441 / JCM 13301 / NBRC 103674 / ABI70S6) TaxID=1298851 RepID=A0A0S3QTR7_THET7|nr:SufD family Fe-S cluster assembly protein [Thermosulfidibacter takaii]BAT71720.1 Fe-S cluster assembly protein SufBD [Thermosulfidibacter takaii ABI70S6]